MKIVGLVLIALFAQSCFFHTYYKDEDWWYFEDWDTNHDRILDKDEFITGFIGHDMIKKIAPHSRSLTYAEFDSSVARIVKDTGEHVEKKPETSSFDLNADQKLSEQEVATAMFAVADDNSNNEVTGLEFYEWEVYLGPRDTVTTVTMEK